MAEETVKRLDTLAFRALELTNESLQLSGELESLMRGGWLHLAKTRYILGHGATAVAQFDDRERSTSLPVALTTSSTEPWTRYVIEESNTEHKNPFGSLSPAAAKQCQTEFAKAADIVCQMATVRSELLNVNDEYRETLKKKHASEE